MRIEFLNKNKITNSDKKNSRFKSLVLLVFAVLFTVGISSAVFAAVPSTVWVDDDYNYSTSGWNYDHFNNIQDGINAVANSGTVNVADGTYSPFIVTGRNNLDILGDGSSIIVRGVQNVSTNYDNRDAVVFVKGSTNIVLENLDIEGNNLGTINQKSYGVIYEESSGEIKNCIISPNTIGDMSSVGIGIWDNSDVTIDPTIIKNFGRIGIFIYNGCTAEILDSTIIGQVYNGEGEVCYGIEIEGAYNDATFGTGSQVTIKGNEIYNCDNTFTPEPAWESGGIYINGWMEYYPEADSTVVIENNQIHDNYEGIIVIKSSSSYAHNNTIYNNRIYGVVSLADYNNDATTFNAENNYWGHYTGPSGHPLINIGYGDNVSDNVDFCPFWDSYPNGNSISCYLDNDGPVVSDIHVTPEYNNGKFNVSATATDTEHENYPWSPIKTVEYFIGHSGTGSCGTPGTGTEILPEDDQSFDENKTTEDVFSANVELYKDGQNWICMQAQDIQDNWGDCECHYFETDTVPPERVYNILLDGVKNPKEKLVCGDNPEINVTVCDSQSNIQGGEFFLDKWIPPEDIPAPWTGYWLEPVNNYLDNGWHCADLSAIINLTNLSEGTHYINQIRGKDIVENWGKVYDQNLNYSFIKDTTPPKTSKNITFADDASVQCCGDETTLPGGVVLTDPCYYVKSGTTITLTGYDYNPDNDTNNGYNDLPGEYSDNVLINYRVWYKANDSDTWHVIDEDYDLQGPVTITLNEDSYHLIEYWSVDGCGYEEDHKWELDIVDTKAPKSFKNLGILAVNCSENDKVLYGITDCSYITQNTLVTLDCEDVYPHPVGDVTLHYKIDWKKNWDDAWQEGNEYSINNNNYSFDYTNDSFHRLTWWCEDALGNTEGNHTELDIVDTQAPILTKTVGTPRVNASDYEGSDGPTTWENKYDWYVTQDTPITLTCKDLGPHPVDNVTIHWYWEWANEGQQGGMSDNYSYNGNSVTFKYTEDSWHHLHYWCEDALGNEISKDEYDVVDTQAPVTTKTINGSKVLIDPNCNQEICDYWITQDSTVKLECQDQGPHPVDNVTLYWRWNLDGGDWTEWNTSNGYAEISFNEDSNHTIQWYCEDALGNTEGTANDPIVEYDQVDTAGPEIVKWVTKQYVQPGESFQVCANITDYKNTTPKELGVGVNDSTVYARLEEGNDPNTYLMHLVEGNTYCTDNISFNDCGKWHVYVDASDLLGNHNEEDGIEVIVDGVAPTGIVLNPHSGNSYYAGKIFPFYAPAVDFGGTHCCSEEDCPASGVAYCDVYAIDYNFEGMNQSDIKECYQDLWTYFEQIGANPYVEKIGEVPYINGVCTGYLTISPNTNLTDTVFMGVEYVDKAGNGAGTLHLALSGIYNATNYLAFNPILSPITMNMEEIGNVQITEPFNLVKSNQLFTVKAKLNDTGLSGTKECIGTIKEGDESIITYTGAVTGNTIDGYICTITGQIPDYSNIDSGAYDFIVDYRLNDDWQVYDLGTVSFGFLVDNDPPEIQILSPQKDAVFGDILTVNTTLIDINGIDNSTVQFRLKEKPGFLGQCWGSGGCQDSGWQNLTYDGSNYAGTLNISDWNSGKYYFYLKACDTIGNCGQLNEY